MTDDERLTAIRARTDAATEGPWHPVGPLDDDDDAALGVTSYASTIAMTCGSASVECGDPTDREADVAFIAAARQDVPWLLDRLAEAKADAEAELDKWVDAETALHTARAGLAEAEAIIAAVRDLIPQAAERDISDSLKRALDGER